MSNAIRYDSLLVRELGRELRERLRGARVDAVFFDRERLRVTVHTRAPRRDAPAAPSLLWRLHPASGHLTRAPAGAGSGRVPVRGVRIDDVSTPPDERIVVMHLGTAADSAPGTPDRIVVELITNQWNAFALAPDDRVVAVLRERQTGARTLRPGSPYLFPPPSARAGAAAPLGLDEWLALLEPVDPAERLRQLPRLVAYSSPANAAWILGSAGTQPGGDPLRRAFARYAGLIHGPLRAVVLHADGAWLPYVATAGSDPGAGRPARSLLEAFEIAAAEADVAPASAAATEDALAVVAERIEAVGRRIRRLREEQEGAAESARQLRVRADVLISSLHRVSRGAARVELRDFEGAALEIELDPALTPAQNATRLYDTARRRDRAAARIPALLQVAETERARLEKLAGRVRDGSATDDELERVKRAQRAARPDDAAAVPYRTYRTSGGLEARVGRGSRANDDLTFRHSSPNDVWLHARDVAGAHVILRWGRTDANPPAADIAEAAVLAALFSKARTSRTVPVDWTRRKHVRKPRKAGPGLVIPERVKTVFVEPDAALEERLREDDLT